VAARCRTRIFFGRTLVRTGVSTAMTLVYRLGKDLKHVTRGSKQQQHNRGVLSRHHNGPAGCTIRRIDSPPYLLQFKGNGDRRSSRNMGTARVQVELPSTRLAVNGEMLPYSSVKSHRRGS
jgi:hypothetical protein